MARTLGSILHGAYGDYYWQATSLRLFAMRNPGARIRLYGTRASRMDALRQFDLSFAESFESWEALLENPPDEFLQYQAHDPDLNREVLAKLPPATLARIDRKHNRIYYPDIRREMPLGDNKRLTLTSQGLDETRRVMQIYGMSPAFFERRPTLAFLWRYRTAQSFIKPLRQPSIEECRRKYSAVFRRLIEDYDCHVVITGMNVATDDSNRARVDAKFASFGLDLPADRCTYLQGLGWAADLEIMSRCTAAAAMASGFAEALEVHRGGGVVLLDPPVLYSARFLRHRVPLFGNMTARGLWHMWATPHSEESIYRRTAGALISGAARSRRPSRD